MAVIRIGVGQVDVLNNNVSNDAMRGKDNALRGHPMPVELANNTVTTNTVTVTVERTIVYRKRGFRPAINDYEYWLTTVRNDAPPSGNTLIDVTVVNEYLR